VDLELQRPQQHLGYRVTQWTLGLWDSQSGSYLLAHVQHGGVVSLLLYPAFLFRNDRHGHSKSDADTYADTYADTNSHADSNTNSDANTYSRAGYAWKHFDSTTSRYR
jgi:hypothetical protein